MNKKGTFIISLDFELQYGIEDHNDDYIMRYKKNLLGAREAIPIILERFRKNGIHATWGIVGMLLAADIEDLKKYTPEVRPSYDDSNMSVYNHMERIGMNMEDDPYHYSGDLFVRIKRTEGQEIASHTFSHYYCEEKGQTIKQFEADIDAASRIMKDKTGRDFSVIIFPRNQINNDYLEVIRRRGINIYRGNLKDRIYNSRKLLVRLLRLFDTYVGILGTHTFDIRDIIRSDGMYNVYSSLFFRPYGRNVWFLEPLKLLRIKWCMSYAAKNGLIFHIWWHPHNFGIDIEENIQNLDSIISHYKKMKSKYGMASMNMSEIVEEAKNVVSMG